MKTIWFRSLTLMLLAVLGTGCTPAQTRPKPKSPRQSFLVPTRKYAPPDAYNRVRQVNAPSPILKEKLPVEAPPLMLPVIRLVSDDKTLEEVAAALAKAMGYDYYCAFSIASKKMTIEALGDVELLGKLVAEKAGITVLVDHENKQIQFLTGVTS
jgi:hypothetical protein